MTQEVLKLALEALKRMERFGNTFGYRSYEQNPYDQVCKAIAAIEALAQPQQKPVGKSPDDWSDWKVTPPTVQPQQEITEKEKISREMTSEIVARRESLAQLATTLRSNT